jgi:hypothetical protein
VSKDKLSLSSSVSRLASHILRLRFEVQLALVLDGLLLLGAGTLSD